VAEILQKNSTETMETKEIKIDEKHLKEIANSFGDDNNYCDYGQPTTTADDKKNKINIDSKNDILDLLQRPDLSLEEKFYSYPEYMSNSLFELMLSCFPKDQMKNIVKSIFADLSDEQATTFLEKTGVLSKLRCASNTYLLSSFLEMLTHLKESTVMYIFSQRDAKTGEVFFLDLFSNIVDRSSLINSLLAMVSTFDESNINKIFKCLSSENWNIMHILHSNEININCIIEIMRKLNVRNFFLQLITLAFSYNAMPAINYVIKCTAPLSSKCHENLIPLLNLIVERFNHESSETKTREMAATLQETIVGFLAKKFDRNNNLVTPILIDAYMYQYYTVKQINETEHSKEEEYNETFWKESDEHENLIKLLKWLNYVPKESQQSDDQRPIDLMIPPSMNLVANTKFYYYMYCDIFIEMELNVDMVLYEPENNEEGGEEEEREVGEVEEEETVEKEEIDIEEEEKD
jgi:hypothetical protein